LDLLAAVLRVLPDIVLVIDKTGRVQIVNAAAAHFLGVDAGGFLLDDLIKIDPVFAQLEALFIGMGAQARQSLEVHSARRKRDFTLKVLALPDRNSYVVLLHDVTDLLDRGRFKDEMLNLASHDLRSPLALILSYCELMIMEIMPSQPELRSYVDVVRESADRMKVMLDAILHMERVRTVPLELRLAINPVDLIEAVVNNIQSLVTQKKQQLIKDVRPDAGTLVADAVFIQEAMENLLHNAVKYTPTGGRIVVHAYAQENHFHFIVEDDGIGIGAEHLPHLFEPFYRAKQRGTETTEGTGLGLSLVKAAVERHQGEVWVESEVGKGSRFGFWLPQQPQKEESR
jgi:two-component system phosphate regulon sensor histidine kinase PhoR